MIAVYNADVWCEDCAEKIKQSIAKKYVMAMLKNIRSDFSHTLLGLDPIDSHAESYVEDLTDKLIGWLDQLRSSADSDDWPSCGHPTEHTDSPQHCGAAEECEIAEELSDGRKVGALLGTELTEHGVNYLNEMLGEFHESNVSLHEFWREQFDSYDLIPDPADKEEEIDDRDESPVEFTESAEGERAREKQARSYDELNGAPEGDHDR